MELENLIRQKIEEYGFIDGVEHYLVFESKFILDNCIDSIVLEIISPMLEEMKERYRATILKRVSSLEVEVLENREYVERSKVSEALEYRDVSIANFSL